ncbi:response regulator, partial [Streptomyces sp. SID1143]|uniref:response regulator n=1 Tax=Streptomyces sp. SID1143 TaxID=3425889 RepID=UPI0040564F65
MTGSPIRLLIADDHPVVRAGLRAVLETEEDIAVVAEAATAEEAVARAGQGGVDVVLMDLQFGAGMTGAQATAAITAHPGAPRVLVVTTYGTDADTLPAIEAGATGYLLKDAPPEELAGGGGGGGGGGRGRGAGGGGRRLPRLGRPPSSVSNR